MISFSQSWKLIINLTLSLGQDDIERGFSQTILQQNIKEDSTSTKRLSKPHVGK